MSELANRLQQLSPEQRLYSLQALSAHMLEGRLYEELFQLASDESFLNTQTGTFLSQPYIPLETVQAAIQGAARIDDAARMAEFVLVHARRVMNMSQESPIDALRDGNLDRATELADVYDIERCILWQLLLAWELRDKGRDGEGRAILRRLCRKKLPRFSGYAWQGELAAHLLACTFEIDEVSVSNLFERLLEDNHRLIMCERLAVRGHFDLALTVSQCVGNALQRDQALNSISTAQVRARHFSAALNTAEQIHSNPVRVQAFCELAEALARIGQSEIAKHTVALAAEASKTVVREIELAYTKSEKRFAAETFVRIAVAQLQAGEPESAGATFDAAFTMAENSSLGWDGMDGILGAIILGQAAIRDVGGVTSTAERIIEKHRTDGNLLGADTQGTMAAALARVGHFSSALAIAAEIGLEDVKAKAIGEIAKVLAETGNTEAATGMFAFAVESAGKAGRDNGRDDALKMLALAQAEVGSITAAIDTVQRLSWKTEQAKLLGWISMLLLQTGRVEAARDLFATALVTSGLETRQWLGMFSGCGSALGQIAVALAGAGEFGVALEIAHWRELRGYESNTLQAIAVEQAKAGHFTGAKETAQDIIDPEHPGRELALMEVAQAQTRAQQFAAAIETAQRIGERNRAELLSQIAIAQMHVGQLSAALATIQRIQFEAFQAKALRQIALAQAEMGKAEASRIIFASAVRAAQGIESSWLRGASLRNIAAAQAQAGEFDDAVATAEEIPDEVHRVMALGKIAIAQSKMGEGEAAAGLITSALRIARGSEWQSDDALKEIAVSMAEAGGSATALEIVQSIGNVRTRDEAFGKIATIQAKAGEFESAAKTVLRIEVEHLHRESALREIAMDQAQSGDFTAAIETAQGLKWESDRAMVLAEIAMAMSDAGQTEAAKSAIGMAKIDGWLPDDELQALALAQARVGELGSALVTAQRSSLKREEHLRALAVRAGPAFGFHAVTTAEAILADRNKRLPEIAAALVEAGDNINFKRLLIPCAYYLDAAYRVCGLLGRLYPAQAATVGRVVRRWCSAEGGS